MKTTDHQWQFLQHVSELIRFAAMRGVKLTAGEMFRPAEMQAIYVQKGLSNTLSGNHQKRMAVDFNFFINESLVYEHPLIIELGQYWESLSPLNRWGGNFKSLKDTPHFERNV